jgi:hypothetical protein
MNGTIFAGARVYYAMFIGVLFWVIAAGAGGPTYLVLPIERI